MERIRENVQIGFAARRVEMDVPARAPVIDRFPAPGRVFREGFLKDPANEREPGQEDPRPPDDRENRDRQEPVYRPELICRTAYGDTGGRPLGDNVNFWESPDIWVVAPDGGSVPIAGQVNQVMVHVWNMGLAPAYGVQVDLYWCIPTPGVNLAGAHKIDSVTPQPFTLQAGEDRILTFDWLVVFQNGGHECLIAEVYDPISDPIAAHFNPKADRHVAQQNISEIRVPPGKTLNLNFIVANLSEGYATSQLRVEPLRGEALQTFAQTIGRDFLPETHGVQAAITRVAVRRARPTINLAENPVAAVFRETLEPVPQRFVRNLLNRAIMAVPAAADLGQADFSLKQTDQRHEQHERGRKDKNWDGDDHTREHGHDDDDSPGAERIEDLTMDPCTQTQAFRLHPGRELAVTLSITAPETPRPALYQAYRVVEMSDGKVTGGLTVLVRLGE